MENPIEKESKSNILGKISLLAGVLSFLLFALIYVYLRFYIEHQAGLQILLAALFIALPIGFVTGLVALIKERVWLGFAINLAAGAILAIALLSLLIIVFYGGYAAAKSLGLAP